MADVRLDETVFCDDDPSFLHEVERRDYDVSENYSTDQVTLRGERYFKNQIINTLVGRFNSLEIEVGSFS